MKPIVLVVMLAMAGTAWGQAVPAAKVTEPSRLVVEAGIGGESGLGYKLPFIKFGGGVEIPLGQRFEAQAFAHYSPTAKEGQAWSRTLQVRGTGIVWVTPNLGATGTLERSWLWSETYSKAAWYPQVGVVWRGTWLDTNLRVYGRYTLPTGGYDAKLGIEAPQLQGPGIRAEAEMLSWLRIYTELDVFHGLRQGNPVCDGTLGDGSQVGIASCGRSGYWTGRTVTGVQFIFR